LTSELKEWPVSFASQQFPLYLPHIDL
jgi:hypothetical protein